jgi:hypothetical protein
VVAIVAVVVEAILIQGSHPIHRPRDSIPSMEDSTNSPMNPANCWLVVSVR